MTTINITTAPVIQHARFEARTDAAPSPQISDKAVAAELAGLIAPLLHDAEKAQAQHAGVSHGGPVLREPARTDAQARDALGGLEPRLREMLAKAIGTLEQTSSDPGAAARVSEGVASVLAAAGSRATGQHDAPDALAAGKAEGAEGTLNRWLVDNPMTKLLVLLRELLTKLEALDRKEGMRNIERSRDMTEKAGKKGIDKAQQMMGGAIGGALVTGAVGAAGLKKSMTSSNMQVNSAKNNLQAGNNVNAATLRSEGMVKTTISERSALNVSSERATQVSTSAGAPQSAVQGTAGTPAGAGSADARVEVSHTERSALSSEDTRTTEMIEIAQQQPQNGEAAAAMAAHTEMMARAQAVAAQATLLNMTAQAAGNTVVAGVGIAAETTEAQRLMAQNASETFQKVAENSKEQAGRTRESRQAAADVAQTLIRMLADTSSAIVRHM